MHLLCVEISTSRPFPSVFKHILMLHLYPMANYSSHNELIYLHIPWTDVFTQLQTEATPLHGLHIPQVDMPLYSDLESDSAFPQ